MPALRLEDFVLQRMLRQFPWTELHPLKGGGRGVRNGLPVEGYVWRGAQRAAERAWLDNAFEGTLMPPGHPGHVCAFCGELISSREKEIVIPVAYSRGKAQYQHAKQDRCLVAMRARSPHRPDGGILERGLPPPGGTAMMASETDQVLRAARAKGYQTTQARRGGGHWFIVHPRTGEKLITLPATPSDYRAIRDTKLRLGRLPDLKQQERDRRKAAASTKIAAAQAKPAAASFSSAAQAMAAEGHLTIPGIRQGQIQTSAWWLWENLRRKGAAGGQAMEWEGRPGWKWDGFTSAEILRLWPKLPPEHHDKQRMEIAMALVQYLKATGHLASLRQHGPKYPAEYWVASTWHGGPDSIGLAVEEAKKSARKTSAERPNHVTAVREAVEQLWANRPAGATAIVFGTQDAWQLVPDTTARSTVSVSLAALADDENYPALTRQNMRGKWAYQPKPERTQPVPEPATTAPERRRPGLRLEVLRDMEAHPNAIQSIDDVTQRLGANRGSVSAALLDWFRRGFIDQVGQGLYVKRVKDEAGPQLTPAEKAEEDQAAGEMSAELDRRDEQRREPATPVMAPPPAPGPAAPAVSGRIADLLRMKPDATLYAEVYRLQTSDGEIILVVDDQGDMHELRRRQ